MGVKRCLVGELPLTEFTFKWFFSCMFPVMNCQYRKGSELLRTYSALIEATFLMGCVMLLDRFTTRIGCFTDATGVGTTTCQTIQKVKLKYSQK